MEETFHSMAEIVHSWEEGLGHGLKPLRKMAETFHSRAEIVQTREESLGQGMEFRGHFRANLRHALVAFHDMAETRQAR